VIFVGSDPYINWNCSHVPHLRIGANCPTPGFSVELLMLLANYLNLTISVFGVSENDEEVDAFKKMIDDNEIDLITELYHKNSSLNKKYDSTIEFLPVCIFC
jgi:hypothetical protein